MNRRGFITGLTGLLVAPAIVRASSLMPVSVVSWDTPTAGCFVRHYGWDGHVITEAWVVPTVQNNGTYQLILPPEAYPDGTKYTVATLRVKDKPVAEVAKLFWG
jgi:hypothetical protein